MCVTADSRPLGFFLKTCISVLRYWDAGPRRLEGAAAPVWLVLDNNMAAGSGPRRTSVRPRTISTAFSIIVLGLISTVTSADTIKVSDNQHQVQARLSREQALACSLPSKSLPGSAFERSHTKPFTKVNCSYSQAGVKTYEHLPYPAVNTLFIQCSYSVHTAK